MKLLKQFVPLLAPKRYKGAKGGRASGKSHFFASAIVKACITYSNINVVCIREIQKSLKHSAKKLIEDKIREENLGRYFYITQSEIQSITGSLIIFQGMQDHTADSIKSLEAFDIAWVEEAQSISSRSLELLLPTIRAKNSEIWFSWNPTFEDDPIEILFDSLNDNNSTLIISNYDTNAFLADTIKEEAERHKISNPDTFEHVWLGKFKTSNSGSVYKFNRDFNSTDREIKPKEDLIIGQDFNIGGCCSVVYVRDEDNIYAVDEFKSYDTFEVAENILTRYSGHRIEIIPDASGGANKTSSSRSDIAILSKVGRVSAPKSNPRVEDRINAMNEKYKNKTLFINTKKCPNFTKSQIKQQYDEIGNPEKFSGAATIDDWNDAGSYPIAYLFGLYKPEVKQLALNFR